MRLTLILLVAAMVSVHANGVSQTITYTGTGVRLEKVFDIIKQQTGYSVVSSARLLTSARPVSVNAKNVALGQFLQLILEGQPLVYSLEGQNIIISRRLVPEAPSSADSVLYQDTLLHDVRGAITGTQNEPLVNANVVIKRTMKGTQTSVTGEFVLKNVMDGDEIIVSFIGYATQRIKLGNNRYLLCVMQVSNDQLDETLVQAYGITSKRLTTGNISVLTEKEIAKQPVMNPLLTLAGRIPGMTVTPVSGYASAPIKVEIRGRSSLNPGFTSEPLYIIDGVPFTNLEIGEITTYQGGSPGVIQNGVFSPAGGLSPMFNLSPGDIKSIEILKDADATAIYGSRGANGVILINTKKGRSGKSELTIDISSGFSKATRYWDMLGTPEYLQMRREAFRNDGIIPTATNAPDLELWDTTRNVNWQRELWGGSGKFTNASVALSGGNDNTRFRISGNYSRQTEILTVSGASQRGGLAFNLNNASLNRKFKTDLSASYTFSDVDAVFTPSAVTMSPNAPSIYDKNGDLNFAEWNEGGVGSMYPFGSLKQTHSSKTATLVSSLNLQYELFRGMELSSSFGYTNTHNEPTTTTPISAQNPLYFPAGNVYKGTNDNNNFIIEPKLEYKTQIGRSNMNVLVGGTLQSVVTQGKSVLGFGYTNDDLLGSVEMAPLSFVSDKRGEYKYSAVFGRINYNFQNKYLFNLSGRRDGSSRFGPGKQFGNFGAVGAAWIASEESWVKSFLPSFISFVKFRGSYGITGKDGVGEYRYLTQWSSVGAQSYYTYGGITPLVSQHAVNPEYHWESNKKLELASSMSFLENRINLEVSWYRFRCNNQLVEYPTPLFTGFGTVTANWAANVQNTGWEAGFDATIIKKENFSWSVNGNFSANKNKLLAYPDIDQSPYASLYQIGKSINTLYLLHHKGIDPQTGKHTYDDVNHNGTIDPGYQLPFGTGNDDRNVALNIDPKFFGGFGTNLHYKGWDFSMFFQYRKQIAKNAYSIIRPGSFSNISPQIMKDHWQKPGDNTRFARFTTMPDNTDYYVENSDLAYSDASFIRLNNLAISYSFPGKILGKAAQRLKVSVNAQNVFVITGYEGIDPESSSFGEMPQPKVITAGISYSF